MMGDVTALATFSTARGTAILRRATADDVPAVVALLADDPLGAAREDATGMDDYLRAFAVIDADPAHLLLVAVGSGGGADGAVLGTLHLTVLPGLDRRGASRAQIEAVRVRADHRGGGLGRAMATWALEEAGRRGCALAQLTSDRSRTDAHRFWADLGFTASHVGFKRPL
jgi:GNAT superfamily N-acetyltransferase